MIPCNPSLFTDIVKPKGSTWARNPLPRIYDRRKAGLDDPAQCPGANVKNASGLYGCLAFPAPCPWDTYVTDGMTPCNQTLGGGLLGRCDSNGRSQCSDDWTVGVISDHVLIPGDLAAGEYSTPSAYQNRALVLAARTLNAKGQSRVTLSLR